MNPSRLGSEEARRTGFRASPHRRESFEKKVP